MYSLSTEDDDTFNNLDVFQMSPDYVLFSNSVLCALNHSQSLGLNRQLITISLSTSFVELCSLELILCSVKLL